MSILYLMRHAKSSWKDASLSDRERPLKGRGRRDAPEMGRRLAADGPLPERVVCSPARRALETAQGVLAGAGCPGLPLEQDERLYFTGFRGWLDAIAEVDPSCGVLLVVGHNPDFSDLVARLCGQGAYKDLPTASLARLIVVGDWAGLSAKQVVSCTIDWPRNADSA